MGERDDGLPFRRSRQLVRRSGPARAFHCPLGELLAGISHFHWKMKKIQLVSDYIDSRQNEIHKYNKTYNVDKSLSINGRNMTNFGLFRKYITNYLENYPGLNKDMILLCRQLQPTAQGMPLEIYTFSKDQRFEQYEYIMADIFDHIIASIVYFDLEIYEMPSDKSNFTL